MICFDEFVDFSGISSGYLSGILIFTKLSFALFSALDGASEMAKDWKKNFRKRILCSAFRRWFDWWIYCDNVLCLKITILINISIDFNLNSENTEGFMKRRFVCDPLWWIIWQICWGCLCLSNWFGLKWSIDRCDDDLHRLS